MILWVDERWTIPIAETLFLDHLKECKRVRAPSIEVTIKGKGIWRYTVEYDLDAMSGHESFCALTKEGMRLVRNIMSIGKGVVVGDCVGKGQYKTRQSAKEVARQLEEVLSDRSLWVEMNCLNGA